MTIKQQYIINTKTPYTSNRVFINNVERNPVYGVNGMFKINYSKNGVIRKSTIEVKNGNVVPRK